MPREIIHGQTPDATTELVVQWTPSLHLQVGVESVGGYAMLDMLTGRAGLSPEGAATVEPTHPLHKIGKAVEAVVLDYQKRTEGSYGELAGLILDAITGNSDGAASTGLWLESLDRQGANRLVKAIRRARNAVYGADE